VKLEQSFEVDAPVAEVWGALIDVERVAPCLPGAEITEKAGDGTYRGTFQVKLGPATAAYAGELQLETADEAAHVCVMRANGRDKRGQGSAKATITSRMADAGGGTRVEVETDLQITGRLARFGRGGMMEDISNRLMREFAECLAKQFAPAEPGAAGEPAAPPAAKPISGFRLFFAALRDRLKRLFRR
jgi:carbon monoxide dehydrogenase subunit G